MPLIEVNREEVKAAAKKIAAKHDVPYVGGKCCGGAFDGLEKAVMNSGKAAVSASLTAALANSGLPQEVQDALKLSVAKATDIGMLAAQGLVHTGVKSFQDKATAIAAAQLNIAAHDAIQQAVTSDQTIAVVLGSNHEPINE